MCSRPAESRKTNMTSFRNKITRRKRKYITSGSINNVQFLTTKVLDARESILTNEDIVMALKPEMITKNTSSRKSNSSQFYAYNETPLQKSASLERPSQNEFLQYVKRKSASLGKQFKDTDSKIVLDAPEINFNIPNNINDVTTSSNVEIRVKRSEPQVNIHSVRNNDTYMCSNKTEIYKPEKSSLYRERNSKMQYKVVETSEKQKTDVENKRGKIKKKAVKNDLKNSDIPIITDDKKKNMSDSYLKRVKSKIYKHRNDSNVSEMTEDKNKKIKEKKMSKISQTCDNIPEENEVQIKKSASTNFLRQYSNLERVRPKTFGVRNSTIGVSDLVDSTTNVLKVPIEQPKLMKSKSSSAINLNLLRNRRNKIQEQCRNSKNADVEFSFIAFSVPQNKTMVINRKLDKNIVGDSLVSKKERPTSWNLDAKGILFILISL